jgi:hypothetical protein
MTDHRTRLYLNFLVTPEFHYGKRKRGLMSDRNFHVVLLYGVGVRSREHHEVDQK